MPSSPWQFKYVMVDQTGLSTISLELFVETLGLPLEGHGGDCYHSEQIAGCKSLGIWPLSQTAEACFGTAHWPVERPVPQVSIEFDVADAAAVDPAARELEQAE